MELSRPIPSTYRSCHSDLLNEAPIANLAPTQVVSAGQLPNEHDPVNLQLRPYPTQRLVDGKLKVNVDQPTAIFSGNSSSASEAMSACSYSTSGHTTKPAKLSIAGSGGVATNPPQHLRSDRARSAEPAADLITVRRCYSLTAPLLVPLSPMTGP